LEEGEEASLHRKAIGKEEVDLEEAAGLEAEEVFAQKTFHCQLGMATWARLFPSSF
jgi:hypothetical protein